MCIRFVKATGAPNEFWNRLVRDAGCELDWHPVQPDLARTRAAGRQQRCFLSKTLRETGSDAAALHGLRTLRNVAGGVRKAAAVPHAAVVFNPAKLSSTSLEEMRHEVRLHEESLGWGATTWNETSADDDDRAAREANASHPKLIVVAGGDGTVRTVAECSHSEGIPLGVVPVGSGNLLARNLWLPVNDRSETVRIAFHGADRRIDLAVAELADASGHVKRFVFLVMAGIGLDARMASGTNSAVKKHVGWVAYADPILRSVFSGERFSVSYSLDGGRRRTVRAHTMIVGNCGTLTAGLLLLPDATPDDGLLDIVALNPAGFGGWAGVGSRLVLNGPLHRSRGGRLLLRVAPGVSAIRYGQARVILARFNQPQAIELDGDSFGDVVRARITVRPGGVIVRVPDQPSRLERRDH